MKPLLLTFILVLPGIVFAQTNGFDLSNATIPRDQILSGGPPRDGIPSIDQPKFQSAGEVDWLQAEDLVFAVGNKAYPLRILVWHEIVNDVVDERPVAVTYCPLCGTAMVFDREIEDETRTFGVSGLLYQSDVLMYDRESESLWSQLAMKSVSGPAANTELTWLPGQLLTWAAWKSANPKGDVLSRETGFRRNYERMPYQGYEDRPDTLFPVPETRTELGNKEWVVGVIVGERALALPIARLSEQGGKPISVKIGESVLEVNYDPESRLTKISDADGVELPSVQVFWFAWQAFYPETILWK